MILNKDAIWVGLLIGLAIPFVGYALLLTLYEQFELWGWVSQSGFPANFRKRTLMVIALCLNIFPLNFFNKRRFTQSMRGIVIPTAAYVVLWLVLFGKEIL